jgi:ligand-binding SRPBCC domain-containing protein
MTPYLLERNQFIAVDRDTTFAFFAGPHNLETLTPPWLRFEILTPDPIEMREGALLDYELRLRGIRMRWQSEITLWRPSFEFVDVQRRGPYLLWQHRHVFTPISGGTLVSDIVSYTVPGGAIVDRVVVRPDLERIFDYRARQLDAWARERMAAVNENERLETAQKGGPQWP